MATTLDYTPGAAPIKSATRFGDVSAPAFSGHGAIPYVDTGADDGVYYIDHMDHDMVVFQTIRPENCDFELVIRDKDTITYEVSHSALDIYGNLVVSHDWVGPWRTCWQLRCGVDVITAGPHNSFYTKAGDDFTKIGGVSWEGYFDRRHQPYNAAHALVYANVIGTPPTGLHYEFYDITAATDISHIVDALFTSIFAKANSLPITYTRTNIGYGIVHYEVSLGDLSKFLGMLQSLADNAPGFDFWIDPVTLQLHLASPYRYGSNAAIVSGGSGGGGITYVFNNTTIPHTASLEFTNTGPAGTHIVGTGTPVSTGTLEGISLGTPGGNEEVYWRLDDTFNAGDQAIDLGVIEDQTRQNFALGLQPEHEIPLTVYPDQIPNFWSTFKKGKAIWINYDLISHMINSPQRIVSLSGHIDDGGNCEVNLGLNQIYDVDPTVGVAEG